MLAQEIAAESELEVRQAALQALVGQAVGPLAPPRSELALEAPQPNRLQDWLSAAEQDALMVQVQRLQAEIASREVDKQRAGHYPTLDLVANRGKSKSFAASGSMIDSDIANVGVQVNIPLYQGGWSCRGNEKRWPTGRPPNPPWRLRGVMPHWQRGSITSV